VLKNHLDVATGFDSVSRHTTFCLGTASLHVMNPIPDTFNLQQMKIAEHREIERELEPDIILQALEEQVEYKNLLERSARYRIGESFLLNRGISMKADRLCRSFQERSGWYRDLHLWASRGSMLSPRIRDQMSFHRYYAGENSALFDVVGDDEENAGEATALNICLSGHVLQFGSDEECLFQMGHAYARVLDECPPYHLMLKANSPVGYEQRKLISRLLRFQGALYACLGYFTCGCLQTAKRELFKMETGMDAEKLGLDVDNFGTSNETATATGFDWHDEESILWRDIPSIVADPFYFYTLERFADAVSLDAERAMIGPTFTFKLSSELSRVNEAMHEKQEEMPEYERSLRERLKILAQYAVAEADREVREEEKQAILDSCDASVIDELREHAQWKPGVEGNTLEVLGFYINVTPSGFLSRHAAEILFGCIMTSFSDREFADEEMEAIRGIAERMGVELVDVQAIHRAVMTKMKELGQSGPEEECIEEVTRL